MFLHGSTTDGDLVDGVTNPSGYCTWKPCSSTLVGINFNINLVVCVVFTTTGTMLSVEPLLHFLIPLESRVRASGQEQVENGSDLSAKEIFSRRRGVGAGAAWSSSISLEELLDS